MSSVVAVPSGPGVAYIAVFFGHGCASPSAPYLETAFHPHIFNHIADASVTLTFGYSEDVIEILRCRLVLLSETGSLGAFGTHRAVCRLRGHRRPVGHQVLAALGLLGRARVYFPCPLSELPGMAFVGMACLGVIEESDVVGGIMEIISEVEV